MKIAVIGTGYVGLVTGTCFAGSGNDVICVDIDEDKVRSLQRGRVPFFEPGLDDMVRSNIDEGRLSFTTDIALAIRESLLVFIAVGTPQTENGEADISSVLEVARSIGENLDGYKIVITKSTVPVGTTEKVHDTIKSLTDQKFGVASNPEFLKEGAAIDDFLKPDRVVIGVEEESVGSVMRELYAPFMMSSDRTIVISIRSSEMSKYASNAMLATRISFMNDIANLCELLGANVSEVRSVVGSDSRIGRYYLYPGIGYGGSCFPKDVKALEKMAHDVGYEPRVVTAVDRVNVAQKERFFNKIVRFFDDDLDGKRIAVWGVSFKPNTDDIREAPSLYVISGLLEAGCSVAVHDPAAMENARAVFGDNIDYFESYYDVCNGADALVIHTEWSQYRQPNFEMIKELMKTPVIFDGRNIYDYMRLEALDIKYFRVGR
ncbi:MAG: UDP-glucose/GDP-mannose dehydrogenase family protein [Candidatus Dadabacteria bacterium]|nr:UDP-glucose/GDP-mannose dehydrogenase family protein [Candidatus Dadabacteria bacterium]